MRKNSRGELSGAVRDEPLAEVQRQEEEVPHATSRRFRLTPMLSPSQGGEPTALLKRPHNIILIGAEVLTSTSLPRLWEVRTRILSGALLANSRRQVPVLTMAKGLISCSR